jgi:hypothetical protein
MLRGWPPPRRVCGASPIMTKLGLLQRGAEAQGAVLSIRWVAVRPLIGVSSWELGLAMFEVVMGDVVVSEALVPVMMSSL